MLTSAFVLVYCLAVQDMIYSGEDLYMTLLFVSAGRSENLVSLKYNKERYA